jgi:hypothetical protein
MTWGQRVKHLASWAYWSFGTWLFYEEPEAEEQVIDLPPAPHYHIDAEMVMVVYTADSEQARVYTAEVVPQIYTGD